MEPISDALDQSFNAQIKGCTIFGSPFSALVLEAIQADARIGGPYARLLQPFNGLDLSGAMQAAAALRPLGWLHALVLKGRAPKLAAMYPPNPEPDPAHLRAEITRLAHERFDDAAAFLTSPPQTNEVRRTLCLLGGFTTIAAETGLPLRTFEIGASAGLNLNWDRFFYRLGDLATWGDSDSPVVIDGAWTGPPPPLNPVQVVERRGCDIAPVDVRDTDQALRLQAFVWAGQEDRMARLRAAIGVAIARGALPEQADAAQWVEQNVRPEPGVATVLYHSVMWQYMPLETRQRITDHMARMGKLATKEAPLAWLSMEAPARMSVKMDLDLTLWPNGERRRLAQVHPHGSAVDWSGAA